MNGAKTVKLLAFFVIRCRPVAHLGPDQRREKYENLCRLVAHLGPDERREYIEDPCVF